jgi:hypothetical protein
MRILIYPWEVPGWDWPPLPVHELQATEEPRPTPHGTTPALATPGVRRSAPAFPATPPPYPSRPRIDQGSGGLNDLPAGL